MQGIQCLEWSHLLYVFLKKKKCRFLLNWPVQSVLTVPSHHLPSSPSNARLASCSRSSFLSPPSPRKDVMSFNGRNIILSFSELVLFRALFAVRERKAEIQWRECQAWNLVLCKQMQRSTSIIFHSCFPLVAEPWWDLPGGWGGHKIVQPWQDPSECYGPYFGPNPKYLWHCEGAQSWKEMVIL